MTDVRTPEAPSAAPESHGLKTDVAHARQARRGRHAFAVLTASTILAVVAMFGVLAIRGPALHHADQQPTSRISDQANTTPPARSLPAGNPQ